MKHIKELTIRCPWCGQNIIVQLDEDTGEITSVSFCINQESNLGNIDLGVKEVNYG